MRFVLPSFGNSCWLTVQGLLRFCSTHDSEETKSNLQRVAQQYQDQYNSRRAARGEEKKKDPKDRRVPVPVETSIRYLKSKGV